MQTQWRYAFNGVRLGLDLPGVESAGRLAGIDITPEIFELLTAMEQTVLESDEKRRGQTHD